MSAETEDDIFNVVFWTLFVCWLVNGAALALNGGSLW